ncbi:MAG: hypothetical protein Kow0077_12980 [Anaerolineae bacterium]
MPQPNERPPFRVTASRIAWECPWYAIRQDDLVLPDGSAGQYNVILKPDAVWIVPVTKAGEIVLIRTYRHTLGEWCWEVPAGSVPPGQTPQEAARMELREEVGGQAATWQYLLSAATMNGVGREIGHYFLARGVTLARPHHEPAEVIRVQPVTIAQALEMAYTGEINDTPSIAALLLAAPHLR